MKRLALALLFALALNAAPTVAEEVRPRDRAAQTRAVDARDTGNEKRGTHQEADGGATATGDGGGY